MQSTISKLKRTQRRAVSLSADQLIETGFLSSGQPIPLVIKPVVEGLDITQWAQNNQTLLKNLLLQHGALLLRGFKVKTAEKLNQFVQASSDGKLLKYIDRTSPRTTVKGKIYTSTIYPAEYPIMLHHELTYAVNYPLKIYFCCTKAAEAGGETPIADGRKVYQKIDSEIVQAFQAKKWMLVRNYNDGLGLPWQEVFQTEERAAVEDYCKKNTIEFIWKSGDRLQTRQIRAAVHNHYQTGEPIWFNHAAFFHYTNLNADLRAEFNVEDLPYNTYYGDGSAIAPETISHINQVYQQEKIMFPWQEGDIMMLDNMAVAHGRQPYKGEREILAAMSEPSH